MQNFTKEAVTNGYDMAGAFIQSYDETPRPVWNENQPEMVDEETFFGLKAQINAARGGAGAADNLADAASAALGKGPNAFPGAPLTDLQRRALLQNQADTLANIERSQANSALSEALRERMVRLGRERLKTIEEVLKSGVAAPKN